MLQRIQTLFLLGALICLCLVFVFPVWKGTFQVDNETIYPVYDVFVKGLSIDSIVILAISTTNILLCAVAIVLFKKRPVQMKVVAINVFLIALSVAFMLLNVKNLSEQIEGTKITELYNVAFYLPIVALLFHVAAFRFIKKDENLIRSVDRIR